jgi:hypothetical protein
MILHHCYTPNDCHTHTVQEFNGVTSGSFSAPDHQYPCWIELRLTATDSGGQTSTAVSVRLDPKTVVLAFKTTPGGLKLANLTVSNSAQPTPFTVTVVVGSANSVRAPSPQTLNRSTYYFSSWSDGGAQNHVITAPATNTTLSMTEIGSPPRSPARCSLEPCLPRSTGVAPGQFPRLTARRLKESTLTRSRSIRPGGTEFVQQPPPEAARTPGAGPLVQALPAGGGRAAAQLLGWQQAPRRRGAGHEDERGDAVAVRHTARDAAARAGRRWRQQRLDALPQLGRKESVDNGGHTRASPPWLDRPKPSSRTVPDRPLNRSWPAARPASMTAMGCGPVWRMPSR